ncbi:MAG: TRAP transporter substrate-binding protein DctP [Candidatus Adiutrix sp.]|jgi:TRAP-type mannitol/chloroaromatic compound transport system substrate-binding protein|nr:TRAP transporter substrate-binding protein DctP [Candidatus Adiutrix sp.]
MIRKSLMFLLTIVCLTAFSTAALAQTAAKPIVWKSQTLWNAGEIPQKTFEDLCENIKVMSAGRLIIEAYPSGAIVPQNETLDALQNGVLDVIHVWPGYGAPKNPALAAISDLIFAYRSPIELDTWLVKKGGLELFRKIYAPFKGYPVGAMYWGVESWPSRKPLSKAEDFKGLKIRLSQGMQSEVLTAFGASVIQLPGNEIFPAMDKGVIDACDWSTIGVNNSLGLFDLNGVNYSNYPGFHSMPIGDFTVNIDKWNELTPDLKAIVETAVRRWMIDSWETIYVADIEFVQKHRDDPNSKVTITTFPPEEMEKMTVAAQKVWQEWKTKNADSKAVIESQESWLREIGRIK